MANVVLEFIELSDTTICIKKLVATSSVNDSPKSKYFVA